MHSRNPSGLLNGIGPCISSKYNGVVEVVRTPWWKMRDPLHTRISFWYDFPNTFLKLIINKVQYINRKIIVASSRTTNEPHFNDGLG